MSMLSQDAARRCIAKLQPIGRRPPDLPPASIFCQYGMCRPHETHAWGCCEWTHGQVLNAGGRFLDKLPIGF